MKLTVASEPRNCVLAGILLFLFLAPAALQGQGLRRTGQKRADESGPGLAARYSQDRGIEKNPAVIYATGFESGIEGDLKKRRKGVEILKSKKLARSGRACAKIRATRGVDAGGDLQLTWRKGVDRCYLRVYCRFDKNTVTPHHFINMSGHMPTYKYRFGGGAGIRPPGGENGKFGTTLEPPNLDRAPKGRKGWMFYTYWHEMRSWQTPGGKADGRPNAYYGNSFMPDDQRPFVGREKWICLEFMVQLNKIGKHDGEQAFWIDGKKVGHYGPGRPMSAWIRDRLVTKGTWYKNPQPFEGFNWRTDKRLQINRAMLQWYVSGRAAKRGKADKNIVYFDNLVVATKYIGPMSDKK